MSISQAEHAYIFICAIGVFLSSVSSKATLMLAAAAACTFFIPSYKVTVEDASKANLLTVIIICLAVAPILAISTAIIDVSKPAEASILFIATYLSLRPYRLLVTTLIKKGVCNS